MGYKIDNVKVNEILSELSKEYDMYRQEYCGCVYSKQEREK